MTNASPKITHYVSLDLGSDSMAAYYEEINPPRAGLIPLQESAETHPYKDDLDLLRERGVLAKRLRTRILLRDPVPAAQLPANHTQMHFVDPQGQWIPKHESVFVFFDRKDSKNPVMPNPKLVFQMGSQQAVPELTVLAPPPPTVRHDPAVLLQDLTVQVVNNLVLRSSVLRKVLPGQVHLILTIPNVYSITHSRQLENFVRQHTSVGEVSVVYESDALAYYVLDLRAPEPTRRFREQVMKPKAQQELHLITIDIGRGTTDLSMIRMQPASEAVRQDQHTVLARTGVCSGGQALTYVFVEHFDKRVREVFGTAKVDLPHAFKTIAPQHRIDQRITNELLEAYIEAIKRSITADYKLGLREADEMEFVKAIIDLLLRNVPATEHDRLRGLLRAALRLPADLLNPTGATKPLWKRVAEWFGRGTAPSNPLVESLRQYVRTNVDEMLTHLLLIANERERQQLPKSRGTHDVLQHHDAFVIVAGQASQFKPIRQAIRRWFDGKLPARHIHFVDDPAAPDESKVACCKGAVGFLSAKALHMNADEFFGTYGFCSGMQLVGRPTFMPADTAELVRNGTTTVKDLTLGLYRFVYVVRPMSIDPERDSYVPELYDGYTAVLSDIQNAPASVVVEYDRATQRLCVNGTPMDVVTTHGYVNEKVQPKVWPIIVAID
jgi:hypothetical protein